jgi:hypothetical protein
MNDREKNKEKPTDSLTIIRQFFTTAFWRFESPAWRNNEEDFNEQISKSEMKRWVELYLQENADTFKRIECKIKVKLENGKIFEFNPFIECLIMPPKYELRWLPLYNNEKPKVQFMFCNDVFEMVATEGIESDNIDCLNEAKFDTKNMKLNLNIENK